jgi:hypothetical protein
METNRKIALSKQQRRYDFIVALWQAAGGKRLESVDFMEIATREGFSREEALDTYRYFLSEGFFERNIPPSIVSLSHRAIVEIEQSFRTPDQATEHFSSTVIQNFNAPVGSVQSGPNSTANVNQNFGPNMAEVAQLISQLRAQFETLPTGVREEAIDVVDGLTEELQRPVPSKGKVKAFLSQVGVFAEDVAAGASASLLAEAITKYLGS